MILRSDVTTRIISGFNNATRGVRIRFLKIELKRGILEYRERTGQYGCGLRLEAVIRPEICKLARRVNRTADKLKALDPDFPAESWKPYPEG